MWNEGEGGNILFRVECLLSTLVPRKTWVSLIIHGQNVLVILLTRHGSIIDILHDCT